MLDSRRLETFRTVAHCGRLSEAARQLNLSQPAVTAQVQQLEEALGCRLFTRSHSGIQLTAEGSRLLEVAEEVHRLLGEATRHLAEPGADLGPLKLGASTTAAAYLLPRYLARFQRERPDTQILLEVGNTEQVQGWLREGRIDLGMGEGLQRAAQLRLEPFAEEELICVAPGFSAKGFGLPTSSADLARSRIIWREPGSGTRAVVARALTRLSPPRPPRKDDPVIGHTEAIKTAVRAGMGLGFLPRCAILGELERGELRELTLPGLRIQRVFSWVVPPGGATGAAAAFQRAANSWSKKDQN